MSAPEPLAIDLPPATGGPVVMGDTTPPPETPPSPPEPHPPAVILTPLEILDRAIQQGASVEMLEKLMSLQERWDRNQARKAFDAAIAKAKAEIPVIKKNRRVRFDATKPGAKATDYPYEDLAEIASTVDPILGKYGLSYRFRTTSVVNDPVTVTCILSHEAGHCEENTLCAGRDDSAGKNSIQAIGSTVTYLQRYTLKAALGIAAATDDDGKASESGPERISADQIADLQALIGRIDEIDGREHARTDFLNIIHLDRIEDIYVQRFAPARKILVDVLKSRVKKPAKEKK